MTHQKDEKDHSAELIHQPIPDMAGTEPRPNGLDAQTSARVGSSTGPVKPTEGVTLPVGEKPASLRKQGVCVCIGPRGSFYEQGWHLCTACHKQIAISDLNAHLHDASGQRPVGVTAGEAARQDQSKIRARVLAGICSCISTGGKQTCVELGYGVDSLCSQCLAKQLLIATNISSLPQTPQAADGIAAEEKTHGAALLPADPSAAVKTEPLPKTRMRVFGPYEEPDNPNSYLGDVNGDISSVIDTLREYLPLMSDGDEIVFRVKAMTDEAVEALPDL